MQILIKVNIEASYKFLLLPLSQHELKLILVLVLPLHQVIMYVIQFEKIYLQPLQKGE